MVKPWEVLMRLLFCLPLAAVAAGCSLAVRIDVTRQESAPAVASRSALAERTSESPLARLLSEYDTELTRQCANRFVSDEQCGELRRRFVALQQVPDDGRMEAYHALADTTGEVEEPSARRRLLNVLVQIGTVLGRR
jgi:hypothetical protein